MCIYRSVASGGGLIAGGPRLHVLLILVTVNPAFTGYSVSSAQETVDAYYPSPIVPQFESRQPTDVLAVMNQPVLMPCTVYNLADKLVSWVRTRDLNILTHGSTTFTADPRFDIQHQVGSDAWTLKIKSARLNDTGRYECQVNTDPKMSLFFNLKVQEHASPALKAHVSGPRHQYVEEGSTVTFVCDVTSQGHGEGVARPFRPSRAGSVHWLHNGLAVSFQAERGGISIDTVRSDQGISSRMTVAAVGAADAGRYSCGAGDATDSVHLHVRRDGEDYGEHMEAMQRDQASSSGAERCSQCERALTFCAVLLVVTSQCFTPR